MFETIYDDVPAAPSRLAHRYGPQVHLLADAYLLTLLAELGSPSTVQPQVNALVRTLYTALATAAFSAELPRVRVERATRMAERHPEGVYRGQVLERRTRAVSVNIARAGTLPSQVTYDLLNTVLDPGQVRQDHLVMARQVDTASRVTGTQLAGAKIGGDVEGAHVFFPDPMGATGGTLSTAITLYKDQVGGTLARAVCLFLIVTPECLRRLTTDHPDVAIYALRLDRGLSPPDVLGSVPGTHWDREKGLNEHQYIVPGAGGLGEVMNNAFV